MRGNQSSRNPKQSLEEVNTTTSVAPEIVAGSSSVEKEVSSYTDSTTTTNTAVGGER